jgi:hypothetical protein
MATWMMTDNRLALKYFICYCHLFARLPADASVAELELDDKVLALEVVEELGGKVGD